MRLLRLFAWLLAAALTFATLGPPKGRPHSNLGQVDEHSLAFVLLGLAFALAYPRHRLPAVVITTMAGRTGISPAVRPPAATRGSETLSLTC